MRDELKGYIALEHGACDLLRRLDADTGGTRLDGEGDTHSGHSDEGGAGDGTSKPKPTSKPRTTSLTRNKKGAAGR